MKKNLFLLFAIYFFVIQSWIISFLRNETKFFVLWIINLWIIMIVTLSYSYFEKWNKKEEETVSFKKERENIIWEKAHKKTNYKNKLFWISIVFALISFVFFKWYLLSNKLIIASWIWFILYMALFYISRSYKTHKLFLSLWNSKVYLLIFILWLILSWFDSTIPSIKQETAVWCIINVVSNWGKYTTQTPTNENEIYKPEEIIINQNSWEQEEIIQTWTIITWENIYEQTQTNAQTTETNYLNDWDLTILDAIKYLISENNIQLDTKQNVKFTYISYQNTNYPYFKTAYMKKIIWTSTNPDKKIICQTYIVMKWIAESWDISNNTNSLQTYRNKADELWKLNWCQKNKYVTLENL